MIQEGTKVGHKILDCFYGFISKNSEYELEREDMKYLLAYLMCHEYQVNGEKPLNILFMPVAMSFPAKKKEIKDVRCGSTKYVPK